MINNSRNIMNLKEVADYLGVHTSTIYRYAQDGYIPAFKIGSDWRFTKAHIDKWIEQQVANNGRKHQMHVQAKKAN